MTRKWAAAAVREHDAPTVRAGIRGVDTAAGIVSKRNRDAPPPTANSCGDDYML